MDKSGSTVIHLGLEEFEILLFKPVVEKNDSGCN